MKLVIPFCLVGLKFSQAAASHENNEERNFQELIALVREQGGTVSPTIGLFNNVNVRGLVAKEPLDEGKVLLAVPPNLILSASVATQRNPGCAVQSILDECDGKRGKKADCFALLRVSGNSPDVEQRVLELAAFLVARLHSSGEAPEDNDLPCQTFASPPHLFDPWLKLLPSQDSEALANLPVFAVHDSRCKSALNGTKISEIARQQRADWARQWEVLSRRVPSLGRRSSDNFFHAKALIMTRAYSAHLTKDVPIEPVMIPLADMFNMDIKRDKADLLWDNFNVKAKGFRVLSDRSIAIGSQLLETYGDRSNLDLYRTYGFFFEDQPMEPVPLELPMVGMDTENEKQTVPPQTRLLQLQLSSSLFSQLPTLLAFARRSAKIASARDANASQSLHLESCALRILRNHIENQVLMYFGEASLAALREPLDLNPSMSSASCTQYKRFLLEPYGALIDFIELADADLNQATSSQLANARVTPQRKALAAQLWQEWRQQRSSTSRTRARLRKAGVAAMHG